MTENNISDINSSSFGYSCMSPEHSLNDVRITSILGQKVTALQFVSFPR